MMDEMTGHTYDLIIDVMKEIIEHAHDLTEYTRWERL